MDQHGRTYYMDHRTHTMAFEQGRGRGVDMRTRREMLDRRYCVCVLCAVCADYTVCMFRLVGMWTVHGECVG